MTVLYQILCQVLCDLVFCYFDDAGNEVNEVVETGVDLDYWNIRQWRRLYFLLYQRQKNCLTQLKILPTFHNETY